jgi:3-deoxy-7-phosphoheptulonate synthase
MIIITQPTVTDAQIDHIVARIEEFGLRSQVMRGETRVVIGVIGPDELVREKPLGAIPGVESVVPVMKPYKLVAQENGSLPPPVSIGDVKIGSGQRVV